MLQLVATVSTTLLPLGSVVAMPAPTSATNTPSDAPNPQSTAQAVERQPVDFGSRGTSGAAGGVALDGLTTTDPSIALRPAFAPATPPTKATDVKSAWTETSKTIANPDGTYTLETAGGRLNYRNPAGEWQPIDLSLIADPSGLFGLRVKSNDRMVRFGQTDAESALAQIEAGPARLGIRALDFPSVLAPGGAPTPTLAPIESPSPTIAPSATVAPTPSLSAVVTPTPTAEPLPAPTPSEMPAASDAQAMEPSVGVGPSASPEEVAATPAPSSAPSVDSPSTSPSTIPPTPSPSPSASEPPSQPPVDGVVRFKKDDAAGLVTVQATDTGFEFGADLDRPGLANTYAFALDRGDMSVTLGSDGKTILLAQTVKGEGKTDVVAFGVIGAPVVLDGNEVPGPTSAVSVRVFVPGVDTVPPAGISPSALASLGPGEFVAVYTIDPSYLADPKRVYPVRLDPFACLGEGASGCDINGTGLNFDHYIQHGSPGFAPPPGPVFRVGFDSNPSDGVSYATMRGLVYFADVALPDGAVINDALLTLHISAEYGSPAGPMNIYRIVEGWGQSTSWTDWNDGVGYTSTGAASTATIPGSGNMNFDVDAIASAWYTRRGENWSGDLGFAVRLLTESGGEVDFDRSTDSTSSNRPLLTISYVLPKVSVDFDPTLGPNYAPSTMIAGQATTLPVRITNNGSGFDFTVASWLVGYRWFDAKGKTVASGSQALPTCVGDGNPCPVTTSTFALNVTPPATVGQYSLRLDLIRAGIGNYASDFATPSRYYSRNKKSLSADNTRWTGSSVIERDEFAITVTEGGGGSGEGRSVETGDGGQLGLNLSSRNLSYDGAGGVGFSDLIPTDLTYGYDSKYTGDCGGILKACGWSTNWDERFTNASGGSYTYVGPSGTRYQVDTDIDQQMTGSAPVLLQRRRTTLFDENVPSNTPTASLVQPGFGAFSGDWVVAVPESPATSVTVGGAGTTDINSYREVRFAIRSDNVASAAVAFKIHNVNTGADQWFAYTVGPTWTTPYTQVPLYGTITDTWANYSHDLYQDVRSAGGFGGTYDEFEVTDVKILLPTSSASGSVYLDALRLEGHQSLLLDDDPQNLPNWSNPPATATVESTDFVTGPNSLRIASGPISASPDCNQSQPIGSPCYGTTGGALWSHAFAHWSWKKVGGSGAAVVFHLKDQRTGAPCSASSCDLTYYAGPAAPAGAVNPIRVSDVTPVGWARVDRNLLEDARQVLNMFNDTAGGTSPSAPPTQGPTPDDVQIVGYTISGVDGNFLLFDDFMYGSLPDIGADELDHPNASSDTTFTYDFAAIYRDGSIHYFDNVGLLQRIVDRDGNTIQLDWSIPSASVTGAAGHQLDVIHAPSDGVLSGSWTYNREFDLSYSSTTNERSVSFTEKLGSGAAPITGRSTIFTMAKTIANGYGVGDLQSVKPARSVACALPGTPSSCAIFGYTDTTTHRLASVADPRWDQQAAGAGKYQFGITWSGTDPVAIVDQSKTSAAILRVLNYAVSTPLPAASRVEWQDAAGVSKNAARYADITSDGNTLVDYIPLTCGGSNCGTPPSTANLANQKLSASQFDGLARVSTSISYRCPGVAVSGCPAAIQPVTSRQGTKAGAKVDNYHDPLTAGQVAWTQTPDQYVASLRDSGDLDPDLYRTLMAYDENGQQVATTHLAHNENASYATAVLNTVQTSTNLKAYYRLGESSGNPVDSAPGAPYPGSSTSIVYGDRGALIGDLNLSFGFNGSTSKVTSAAPLSQSAYSIEAWVRATDAAETNRGLAGRYIQASGGAALWIDTNGFYSLIHTGTSTNQLHSAVKPRLGSFDHVVGVWDGTTMDLYVNGIQAGSRSMATAPGVGTSQFEIGLYAGATSTAFKGDIDEVALYSEALTGPQVRGHYLAAHRVASQTSTTLLDKQWRSIQVDDQFLSNAGFESGLTDWDWISGAVAHVASSLSDPLVHQPADSSLPPSWGSIETGTTGWVQQDLQMVPGQTFRFQAFDKRVGTTGMARIDVSYWDTAAIAWTSIVHATPVDTTWTGHAWDVTLPLNTDGRVRVLLGESGVQVNDTVFFDDAAVFTTYGRTSYGAYGLVSDAITVSPASGGSIAELKARSNYSATDKVPPIFATTVIANNTGAAFDPATPDINVAKVMTYDAWGHLLTRTDQDGVSTITDYVSSASAVGYATDVADTKNALGEQTSFSYDLVGNPLAATSPRGVTSSTTYDLRDHPLAVTSPVATKSKNAYDLYGVLVSSIANQVDDVPTPTGLDDVVTTYASDEFGQTTSVIGNDGATAGPAGSKVTGDHDLLGNTVSTTAYSTFTGSVWGGARTTSQIFEQYTHGAFNEWRPKATAIRGPGSFAASASPSPLCPDGSGLRCNLVATLDQDGQAIASTDAYGKVSRTYLDLAGRPVINVANYGDGIYTSAQPDQDVTTTTQYDLFGRPTARIDPLGRKVVSSFDALGRPVQRRTIDSGGTSKTDTRTAYTGGGRVDRTSLPGAAGAADTALSWTKTIYDAAGRPVKTLAHYDITGLAGGSLDAFESGKDGWNPSGTGWFTSWGASLSTMGVGNGSAIGPASGGDRLDITTAATANSGTWLDLSGPTFFHTHTYKVRADIRAGTSGFVAQAFFGVDGQGASYASSGDQTLGTTWQTVTFAWTPATDASATVHFAVRGKNAAVGDIYLDNVMIWDTTNPDKNIPTETVYDADGNTIATVLPPGDPATERPLVSTAAYDEAGRQVMAGANALRQYSAAASGTAGLTHYWGLDEVAGNALDAKGSLQLAPSGDPLRGVAGGVDEARPALDFNGSSDYLSASSAASTVTSNFSLEAWFRNDTNGAYQDIAFNGTDNFGYGIAFDGSGNLAAVYSGVNWLSTTVKPAIGQWHHVVLVRNATTATIYLDGVALTPTNSTNTPTVPGAGFSVGRQSAGTGRYFDGAIDEVAVYSLALSSTTISSHVAAGRPVDAVNALTGRTVYDALGRIDSTTDATRTLTKFGYDRLGRVTATTQNYIDGAGSASTAPDDVTSEFAFDAAGELTGYCSAAQIFAMGCDETSPTNVQAWHYSYDDAGHVAVQTPPVNTTAQALDATRWTYDVGARLTSTCDATPGTAACDSPSNVHRSTVPTYDAVGRATRVDTRAGNTSATLALRTDTTYLGDGQVAQAKYSEGATPTLVDTIDFAYDTLGRPLSMSRSGTQLSATTYNTDGTVATRTDGDAGAIGTSTFHYDWAQRLTSVNLPSGFSTAVPTFTWRLDGLIGSRTWNTGGTAATFAYDSAKRLTGITKGALTQTTAYDRDSNVTSEARSFTGVSGDPGTGSQSFTYDALNRVTGSSGLASGARTYTYDRDSNRKTKTEGGATYTYVYDRTDELVSILKTAFSMQSFAYDGYGNLTGDAQTGTAVKTLTYDLGGKLTGLDTAGTTNKTTFVYDALGRIGARFVGSPMTGAVTYSYVGASETVARIHDAISLANTDSLVDIAGDRLGVKVGATLNWFLPDAHGDVAASLDATEATVVNAIRYDAYGQTIATGTAGGTRVGHDNWKYQGRLDVSPSGLATPLYDMSARYYSPGIGAFTQLDSVMGSAQDPLSMNRFLYAEANPATLIDPSGHASLGQGQACSPMADYCSTPSNSNKSGTTPTRNTHARSDDDYTYPSSGRGAPSTSPPQDETTTPANSTPAIPSWLWAEYADYLRSPEYLYHDRQIQPVLYDSEGEAILHFLSSYLFMVSTIAFPGATMAGELAASACGAGDTVCQIVAAGIGGGVYGLGKGGLRALTSTLGRSAIRAFGESGAITARSWADLLVSRAAKAGENQAQAEGIVYLRTDLNGGKPYVGQTASEARFVARQSEHARANLDADFEFEYLGRAQPGLALDRLEEYWIRVLGGPTNLRNPGGFLANARYQMNDARYGAAGGDPLP